MPLSGRSKFEADLAEMPLGFVVREGTGDVLKRKTAVDDGLQTVDLHGEGSGEGRA